MAKQFPLLQVSWVTDSFHEIQKLKILLGAVTGIEPTCPAFRASVLTPTLLHPGTKYIKFASSNHPWEMVLLMLLLQCFHTVEAPPILIS